MDKKKKDKRQKGKKTYRHKFKKADREIKDDS